MLCVFLLDFMVDFHYKLLYYYSENTHGSMRVCIIA